MQDRGPLLNSERPRGRGRFGIDQVAEHLGVSRGTVYYRCRQDGIRPSDFSQLVPWLAGQLLDDGKLDDRVRRRACRLLADDWSGA